MGASCKRLSRESLNDPGTAGQSAPRVCPLRVKSGDDHQRGFAAHVRFAPKADKQQIALAGPLGAKRRHSHCSRFSYSITSSARPSSVIGKASPLLVDYGCAARSAARTMRLTFLIAK